MSLAARAHAAAAMLADVYGSPGHGNKADPLDELVFIILSQMTTAPSFDRVFERLKHQYPQWEALLDESVEELRVVIQDAGLSFQKAPRLLAILRRLAEEFGRPTLNPLRMYTDVDAERYLTSLPGVGTKTAKCVMMYALGRQVLPVDTHVWRVARRLKLIGREVPYQRVHDELEAVVSPDDRYSFHVNVVALGRSVCRARLPGCRTCPIARLCPTSETQLSPSKEPRND